MNETKPSFARPVYYLALGVWLGAMMLAIFAAAVTFPTLKTYAPVVSVEPYTQTAQDTDGFRVLGGAIVPKVLWALSGVGGVCIAVALTAMWISRGSTRAGWVLRSLWAALIVLTLTSAFYFQPRIGSLRARMYDPQLTPEARMAARHQLNNLHPWSERLMTAQVFCLLGVIGVSLLHERRACGGSACCKNSE
ncbi:MAG: DUF4149 domain-containing protein [Phycisphaera sp.]|nr:DUF4149 domain-containing protein [Phycisphaera sp.]